MSNNSEESGSEAGNIENGSDRIEPTGFDFEQALQAIKALQEYASSKVTGDLFKEDRSIYLDIVMKKYPLHLPPVKFIEIFLPHPFHNPQTATSCIFVRDLDKYPLRQPDREKSTRIYKQFFEEMKNLTEFTQVISISQLLTDYKTYESRQKLCHTYDVLLADSRLAGRITKWLGKEFVQSKKIPFLINVTRHVKKNFRRVFNLTRATITPSTLKFKVKIGRLNQPADELLANLKAVVNSVANRIPGKWQNVRSAYVSIPAFFELPVYVDWGSSNMIKFPKVGEKSIGFVEDELTTLQSKEDDDDASVPKVRVYDDGTVRIGEEGGKERRETHWQPPPTRFTRPKKRKLHADGGRSRKSKKMKHEDTIEVKREQEAALKKERKEKRRLSKRSQGLVKVDQKAT